ncbi:hypothetical protein A3Q56_04631 [Intoshia linei]|uniref:LysM domain-containing protein n=1 Tax=Intoshia linei TaxID=1819745 RepID=A0A177B1X9_9BILA|nr:hypothetical protein A3Q56_04631 [Intoshia linei]
MKKEKFALKNIKYGSTNASIHASERLNISHFIKHKILPTDTVFNLCLKYNVNIEDIRFSNKLLNSKQIFAMDEIVIPIQNVPESQEKFPNVKSENVLSLQEYQEWIKVKINIHSTSPKKQSKSQERYTESPPNVFNNIRTFLDKTDTIIENSHQNLRLHADVNIPSTDTINQNSDKAKNSSNRRYNQQPSYKNNVDILYKYGKPTRYVPDIIEYDQYSVYYDTMNRIPRWAMEHITKASLKGKGNRKHSKFGADSINVPKLFQSDRNDFRGGSLSRGHMVPAGDMKLSQKSMDDTFFYTNIVPQNIDNNTGYWNQIESFCRQLTNDFKDVYIISGPLFVPYFDSKDNETYIKYKMNGKNNVAVPTHLFKIIVGVNKENDIYTANVVVPNEKINSKKKLTDFVVPIEMIEKLTGFVFFPKLKQLNLKNLCTDNIRKCKLPLTWQEMQQLKKNEQNPKVHEKNNN